MMKTEWCETGAGEHVTLIHGVGASMESWDGVIDALGDGYRTLRYDLRGHGASAKPPGPYSLDDFIGDLRQLLDHRGIEATTLVGFSFGGMIGPAFTLAHPERVRRLVIVSAVCGRTAQERVRLISRADELERGGTTATIDAAIERWFTPEFRKAHPEIIEARKRRALENDPQGYAAAYRCFAEGDLDDGIGRIACPALIMTGEHDPGSNVRMARLMHERIPGARLAILDRLRHNVLLEAPALVAMHIDDFVRETGWEFRDRAVNRRGGRDDPGRPHPSRSPD